MKTFAFFKRMLIASILLFFCTFQSVWAQQTIVIGPSAKANHPFSQFDSLLTEVSAGKLTGQLTFAFEPGTYTFTKALVINTASFTTKDHITITSVAKNRDSVTFTGSISGGLVQLNNTNYVTFSHVSIQNTNSSGMVVAFMGATDGVTFYHCNLVIPGTATAGANSVIGKGDKQSITTPISNFKLIGNNITGGCRNYINTASTNHIKGFRLDSNVISNTYDGCFTLYYADNISCNFNTFIPRAGTTTWPPGISLAYVTGDSIYGNLVNFSHCTQATFGGNALAITGDTSSKKRFLIANNVLIGHNNAAYKSGISKVVTLSSINCDFVHNSIYNTKTSNSPTSAYTTNGVFLLYLSGAGSDIKCAGNQFITYDAKNQYPIWVDTSMKKFSSDYNNYYTEDSTKQAYVNSTLISGMTALAKATGGDNNSVNLPVSFVDITKGLALNAYAPFMMPNIGINNDYENTPRGKSTFMGAYGIDLKNNDASLTDFAQTNIIGGQSCTIYATLTNMSLTPMTSATIQWMANNVLQTPYKWTGKLAFGEKDTVKIGSITPTAGLMLDMTAWTEIPNGVKDENMANDTIRLSLYVCKGPFKGTVTVGKGNDFATLEDALEALNACGVNGPVTVELDDATFGQLTFSGSIKGSSDTNTVTIKPSKGSMVTIDGGAASSLIIDGASHYVFENLTIGNTNNGVIGVELKGMNEDVTFRNCHIYASTTSTTSSCNAVRYYSASNATTYPVNLRFIGNTIQGGYHNMYLYYTAGTTAQILKSSVYIDSNVMTDAYCYGLYAYYSSVRTFNRNTITNRAGLTNAFYALYASSYGYWEEVIGNRIRLTNNSTSYGLYFGSNSQNGSYNNKQVCHMYNNEVFAESATGAKYGIYLASPTGNFDICHNSVYVANTATASTRYAMYLTNSSTTYKINASNNMAVVGGVSGGTAYALYLGTYGATTYGARSYNNLYCVTGNVAYASAAKTSVAALQTATSQDSNTVSILPDYENIKASLQVNYDTNFLCPIDSNVMYDIEGNPKGNLNVMGAYNPLLFQLDASLKDFAKTSLVAGQSCTVYVTLVNKGMDTLKSVNIEWSVNGVKQTDVAWKGSLPMFAETTVTLGNVTTTPGQILYLSAWTTAPNNGKDMYTANDTINLSQYMCKGVFSGTLTVGNKKDFATLAEAINALYECGINGHVTIEIDKATFGQLTISGSVKGASDTNTITIKPSKGSVVTIDGGAASSLIIDGASHYVFENLTIGNTNDGLVGVELRGMNEDVTFRNCRIYASTTSTTSSCNAVRYYSASNATTYPVNLRFIGNTIQGGYYNMYLYYTAGTTTQLAKSSIYVEGNTLMDAYYYSVYSYYSSVRTFNRNTITDRAGLTNAFYALYAGSYGYWEEVIGNRIRLTNNSTSYGLYFGSNSQNGSYNNKQVCHMYNNEVFAESATGAKYGIYLATPAGNFDICHNSVYVGNTATASTRYAMYLTNSSTTYKINASNNMAVVGGVNGGTAYALYLGTYGATTYGARSYNNLYCVTGNVAYASAAKTSVAALQTATSQDSNTISILPTFDNIKTSLQLASDTAFLCPMDTNVMYDITGAKRTAMTAMGCYNEAVKAYSGIFVIGSSKNADCSFAQLDSLLNEFSTYGANGDITLAFEDGNYTWTKALSINTAFMNGYRLTFTSVSKDRDSVSLTGNISNGFIQLGNMKNVTFSYLTLQRTGAGGHVVWFNGATEGVTFYHCKISAGSSSSGSTCCLGNGDNKDITTPIKNFKLIGNLIDGGCRNNIKGTATNRIQGFRLDSNTITNAYDGSFTLNYADDIAINFNTIIPRTGTSWPAGLSLSYVTGDSIYGNLVNFGKLTTTTFGGNALAITGDTNSKKRFLIANNVFIGHNNSAYRKSGTTNPAISKVVSLNMINCDFVHNSIYNTKASNNPTNTYNNMGVFALYLAGNNSDVKCVGNQFIAFNAKNQYPIYVDASTKKFTSDYNNYYSGDTVIGIYNGNGLGGGTKIPTVAAMAKATGGDAHSVSAAPVFVDSSVDLQLTNYATFVMPNIGIGIDHLGATRDKITAMGAYTTQKLPALDAALVSVVSPNSQSQAGQKTPLKVVIENKGKDTLTTATIGYNLNNSLFTAAPYKWTGRLATGESDTVQIASAVIPQTGANTLMVYVTNANGATGADDVPSNDTLRTQFVIGNAGVLEIELSRIVSPDTNSLVGVSASLQVELINNGTDTLTKTNICYIFGATKMRTFNWTGTLLPKQKAIINIGTVTPTKGKNTVKVFISKPNGVDDSNLKNDTIDVTLNITREPGDASLTEFIGLEKINPNVAKPVSVVIYNKGSKAIDKATINFSINGVAQKAYNYQPKVALAQYKFDTVVIGNYTAKAGKTTYIASIAMKDDMEPTNDTIKETREVYYTDYKLNEIVSPKAITEAFCIGDKMPIAIAVSNTGKMEADFAADYMKVSVTVSGAVKYQLDTTIAKGTLKANALDTFLLGYLPTTAIGSYTINVTIGGAADYDATNNDAKSGFEVTTVSIPYDNSLSAQSKELVFNQTGNVHWDYVTGSGHIGVAPVYGKGYLEFAGSKKAGDKGSIILNGVKIQNFTNPKLSFWYAHASGKDQGDVLVVKVTTDGGANYTELGRVKTAATKAEWKRYDFDLTKFSAEKCLSIVLEATSAGMNQGIDRIMLTAEQDAAISLLPVDMSNYTACNNEAVEVKAVIANVSDMDVELSKDTITFNVSGALQTTGTYVYSNTLKAKATDTVTVGKFVPANNGRYFIDIFMQSQDDKTSNDTARGYSFDMMQDLALIGLDGIDVQTAKNGGDTVIVNALLRNAGNTIIRSSKVQLKVNGNEIANLVANNVIGIGDTVRQPLTYVVPFATKANPTYTLEVNAGFDCDGDSTNNSIQLIGQVNVPDTIDIQVLDILAADTMGKVQINPTVRIANIANVDAVDVKLHVTVYDSAANVIATIAEAITKIDMNDTIDHVCATAYTVPNYTGKYTIVAFVEAYTNDGMLSNDTLSKQFCCTLDNTRISESKGMNWSMGQNYPNPASDITCIPFNMTQDATVVFSVMSANGQMIYREVISANAGSNTINFNVSNLAGGVYYYSMECEGQRFVKKMNVVR